MTGNPICICRHSRTDHDAHANPKCRMRVLLFGKTPCDCPGFEADPKASDE